ncbi:hypothetical protein [Photobacterium kishitanii]|uniref:hypothetical protein n=1 Tax=Photobacterium kishitanii TaxID=318456 RepID=UPI0011B28E1B|nr:hypothetical protein [Photobacterium kishitanii]
MSINFIELNAGVVFMPFDVEAVEVMTINNIKGVVIGGTAVSCEIRGGYNAPIIGIGLCVSEAYYLLRITASDLAAMKAPFSSAIVRSTFSKKPIYSIMLAIPCFTRACQRASIARYIPISW